MVMHRSQTGSLPLGDRSRIHRKLAHVGLLQNSELQQFPFFKASMTLRWDLLDLVSTGFPSQTATYFPPPFSPTRATDRFEI
jgi:hypothetical protein